MPIWQWEKQSPAYGNYGNANQWTVGAGLASLARESAQNTNDARVHNDLADLKYTFIVLDGADRAEFEEAVRWTAELEPHLAAMADASSGAVSAGQIKSGLDALSSTSTLMLLRIDDYGCRGLTGPEFTDDETPEDTYGNFIKLCRLDLFSGKDKASGGSFGLGKAVYWRFSRVQTVLFNSALSVQDAVGTHRTNRIFGVNQGTVHKVHGAKYQGRGYFGLPSSRNGGAVASVWEDDDLARRLHLRRDDPRPGTTALLIGFYDPDRPEVGLKSNPTNDLAKLASELRAGVEESFWPLLSRGRLRVTISTQHGDKHTEQVVDPELTYTELVRALRRFDEGNLDERLDEPYSVIARDVPVKVSRRKTGDAHDTFTHTAKLVVTLSDKQEDTLENKVCLFRKPEMVVQTIDRTFEGRTYHAFLVAGAAIEPAHPTQEHLRADDFLRFAEPPAHDRWIPGSGRNQASQANLTAHYSAPWIPNLKGIEDEVLKALFGLFGTPPPATDDGPDSVLRHLRFLRGEPGRGSATAGAGRKPIATLTAWRVADSRWEVEAEIVARNRPEGWTLTPMLSFVGLDGTHVPVAWHNLTGKGCTVTGDGRVQLEPKPSGRNVKATISGVTIADLPIPADQAAVDLVLTNPGPLEGR